MILEGTVTWKCDKSGKSSPEQTEANRKTRKLHVQSKITHHTVQSTSSCKLCLYNEDIQNFRFNSGRLGAQREKNVTKLQKLALKREI